jgi:hypothetical protein
LFEESNSIIKPPLKARKVPKFIPKTVNKEAYIINAAKTAQLSKRLKTSELYEKARFHKLYGHSTDSEASLDNEFINRVNYLMKTLPNHYFQIRVWFFASDDYGHSISGAADFMPLIPRALNYSIKVNMDRQNPKQIKLSIECFGRSLGILARLFTLAHTLVISSKILPNITIGYFTDDPILRESIFSSVQHMGLNHRFYPNHPKFRHYDVPDLEEFQKFIPGILSWIKGKTATTIRPVRDKHGSMDLRFYRNEYSSGTKKRIIYDNQVLLWEMSRGAFCFIPDTHYEAEVIDAESLIYGPYSACIDLDTASAEYSEILDEVYRFYDFCKEEVNILPHLVHSGNISYHFRFELGEIPENVPGICLPKLTQWSTYFRRHQSEIMMVYLKNAITVLILAYRKHTNAQIGCDLPKFRNKAKFKIFFDNRTGLHQGARIPGSYHHKSQRISRTYDIAQLPPNIAEMKASTEISYISHHLDVLNAPPADFSAQEHNTTSLFEFTSEFYQKNFHDLVYKQEIFHP